MGDNSKNEAVERGVAALAEPVAEALGIELVAVIYTLERGSRILRVYIDKPGGVTIDDCTAISRELSTVLDVEDALIESYSLEVSSPGLDRPLVKERDFVRFSGKRARIRTREAVAGRRNFKALIGNVENGRVTITDTAGKTWEIELSNIDRARLEADL